MNTSPSATGRRSKPGCAAPGASPSTPARSTSYGCSPQNSSTATPAPPARCVKASSRTLTLTRLGVRGQLKRTLESTNPCESMIEIVRRTSRNVKRWSSGEMCLRWTAGGMLEAERQFRRIIGYRDLAKLAIAIEHDLTRPRHPDNAHAPTNETDILVTA